MKQKTIKPVVLCDYREEEFKELIEAFGSEVVLKNLVVGDFVCGNVVVERKSAHDFISSIMDGRLFSQLDRMKRYYERSMLIVEGDLWENGLWKQKAGAMASAFSDFNCSVICSNCKQTTAYIVHNIASREQGTARMPSIVTKDRAIKDDQLRIMASFPSIGEKRAKLLLSKFKTIERILNAEKHEIAEVVGKKSAERIKEVLQRVWNNEEKTGADISEE